MFPWFFSVGAYIEGVDPSIEMVERGNNRLSEVGISLDQIKLGDVSFLATLPSESFDAVLSMNVLGYLTLEEVEVFYREVRRVLKPGGFLIINHSNMLFDMFSINRFTVDFFKEHLISDVDAASRLENLFSYPEAPETVETYRIRENPLTSHFKLKNLGFEEVQQEFVTCYTAPPLLLGPLLDPGRVYPDTLSYSEEDRWKLLLTCSVFCSCSKKL